MKSQDLNRCQARWALYLSQFDYTLINKPGTSMGKAYALSRREDHMAGMENDNKQMTFIPENYIRSLEEIALFDNIKEGHSGCTSPDGSTLCEGLYFYIHKLWVPEKPPSRNVNTIP
jgi:hypothetical protein